MSPASSSPVVSEGANLLSTSVSAITHPALVHVGAQFHQDNGVQRILHISRIPGAVDEDRYFKDKSPRQSTVERYLHSADKIEILCVGMQTSQYARLFDQRLIRTVDKLLLQVEATAT